MKTKILMSVLAIGMAIALIGGATMAWFTDDADVEPAEFTAGTVVVNADGPTSNPAPGKFFDNVNPGDCGKVEWTIINEGTKAVELRVKLSELWQDYLDTDNFFYAPAPDSGWVMYEETEGDDEGIWLYYIDGPVAGTYGLEEGEDPESVKLELVVAFDGESTDDEYQGKWFEMSGIVEAIQASNDAPSAVWEDAWDAVTEEGYEPSGLAATYLGYIQGTKCWNGGGNGDENGGDNGNDEADIVSFDVGLEIVQIKSNGPQHTHWTKVTASITNLTDENGPVTGDVDVIFIITDNSGNEYTKLVPNVSFTNGNNSDSSITNVIVSGIATNDIGLVNIKIGDVVKP